MTSYRHTEDMGEISGFGGSYEQACQAMLETGVNWLNAHPNADLQFQSYDGVYGLVQANSPDAEELEKVIAGAAGDCTGAMMHTVLERCYYIRHHGWDAYCEELRKAQASERE